MNVAVLRNLLTEMKYDKAKTKYLIDEFQHGFDIGYCGPENVRQSAPNLKFRELGTHTTLWNKVMKEVAAKRYAGPFKKIPFDTYIQSPIGLVLKDGGHDTRLIFHLSYLRNVNPPKSLNVNTPNELCSVAYPDFNKAIMLCLRAGVGCKMSKSDMKSAFRNLGVLKRHWCWLIMMAKSPLDGETYHFVDKCLPFGAAISCAIFQAFSNAVAHIVRFKTKMDNVNYLDNFLFVALLLAKCDVQMDIFLKVCADINFPISGEKTFFSTTTMVFLGFLIDSVVQLVLIPQDKLQKGIHMIDNILGK